MTGKVLAVRHVAFEDLGLLQPILEARGYETSYLDAGIHPIDGDILRAPEIVVILGGPIGVYSTDAYPFLAAERAAIAARLADNSPTLGICLGAQLMASALGAPVAATGRHEIGFGPLTLTDDGHTSPLAHLEEVPVLHWHGDQFEIPAGARRLAETPGFPNQAFDLGSEILGLQFHLEADRTQLEQWLIGHANELATVGIDPRRIRDDAVTYGPVLAQAATGVFSDWLDRTEARG